MKKLVLSIAVSSLFMLSACAANFCERKEKWFANHCSGTDVSWSHDATCEAALQNCDEGHIAQANAYVSCLESQNVCSLDTINSCAAQHPGGVNLQCPQKM
jgi:hypothetical protein